LQQRRSAILQLLLAELVSSLAARMASGWLCDAPSMPKFQVRTVLALREDCHLVDDQVDSTAQFLDWFKKPMSNFGVFEYYRIEYEKHHPPA
jgi:hypothetical protein